MEILVESAPAIIVMEETRENRQVMHQPGTRHRDCLFAYFASPYSYHTLEAAHHQAAMSQAESNH